MRKLPTFYRKVTEFLKKNKFVLSENLQKWTSKHDASDEARTLRVSQQQTSLIEVPDESYFINTIFFSVFHTNKSNKILQLLK